MNNILFVGEHLRTYSVQWHTHNEWELVYCTGGQGEFTFGDGSTLTYDAGKAVAIPPNIHHANTSQDGFTNIHMRISDDTLPFKTPFFVSDDSDGHLLSAFREVQYYFDSDIRKRDLMLSALGQLLTSYMIVYRSNDVFSAPVERLRSKIVKHYCDPAFALEAELQSMPFHYDYLRKLFKKEMSVTPLGYLTNLRMNKAKLLLDAMSPHGYTISEVAEMCGYDDPLYFSRVFKKRFGVSPANYARQQQQE